MVEAQTVAAEGAFISTEQLAEMLASYPKDKLCILNATCKPMAETDVFKEHSTSRIPGAKFLDLTICRDLASPYPHMMPD
jgi:3-mercaptopyruvate sulfurtransferase SseA